MRNSFINLLVKPTHECDLICNYCYDRIEKVDVKNKLITDNLIKEIAIKSCRAFENINWIWHGGEPTIAGLDFYKRNMKIIKDISEKYNTNIKFSMQSNGKNLSKNPNLLTELKKMNICISVSLDFSNKNKHRSSINCFNNILELVCNNNLPIINVITSNDFSDLIDTYKKLDKLNISFMFNKVFNNEKLESQLNFMIDNYKKYIDFIFWSTDNIKDRTVKDLISSVILSKNLLCNFDNCIKNFISINPDGDIFPCDRYGKNNSTKYGTTNIKDINFSLIEYLDSDILYKLNNDNILFINENCKKCDIYTFCNGGCKANRIKNNIIDLTIKNNDDCKFLKEIITYIFDILFNIKKENLLNLNEEIYILLFDNNFVTREMIEKLEK